MSKIQIKRHLIILLISFLLNLTCCVFVFAGSVSGIIHNADGSVISDAIISIHALPVDGSWGGHGTYVSQSDGSYTISGLTSGQYKIMANNNKDNNYVFKFYPDTFFWETAQPITVTEGQDSHGINFNLALGGSVSGTVRGPEGNPVANLLVGGQSSKCTGYERQTYTDEFGNYTIIGLPAGEVYVGTCVECSPVISNQYLASEWYNGDTGIEDCNKALGVSINSEEQITGIDFNLENDIPAEIVYTHKFDETFATYYAIYFFNIPDFDPQNIVSITLSNPSGTPIYNYTRADGDTDDFVYTDQWKRFHVNAPGGHPDIGEYTFTIVADTITAVVKHSKTINRIMPIPDSTQMSPSNGAVFTSKTPLLKWSPVDDSSIPAFYRVQIFNSTGYRVFASGREANMLDLVVPNNVLIPGQTYTWHVGVYDHDGWPMAENKGESETFTFTMASALTHEAKPAIDIDSWGAVAYHTNGYDATSGWIKIIDHDGVAYDGSSHQVSVTYNGNTYPLNFQYSDSSVSGFYQLWRNEPVSSGDFVFTVTDPDGNPATVTDKVVVDILQAPDESSFNVNMNGTSPTFTWNPVPGAARYCVRIYNSNGSTAWRGYPETLPSPSYTVPPGVLLPNTTYRYRIETRDAHTGLDVDNVSKSPISYTNYPEFQTGQETTAPLVEPDTLAATWDSSFGGLHLNFWTKIHDAQGVPGNIKSVKVVFPDSSEIPLYLDYNDSFTCGIYVNDSFVLPIDPGVYTVIVEDNDGNITSIMDDLNVNPLAFPSEQSITAVLNGTQGTFNWDPVTGADFYRLEIYDMDFTRLYTFYSSTNSYEIPEGFLKENTFYRYRVTARREFFDQGVDNGSSSRFRELMRTFMTTPDPGTALATIDLNNFGAYIIHTRKAGSSSSNYWLAFSVNISDQDGVPYNISKVQVTYPDNTTVHELSLDSSVAPGTTEGKYSFYEIHDDLVTIQPGTYTFTVIDMATNTATVTDTLHIDLLSLPDDSAPLNNATIGTTTPEISWNSVPNSTRYRVRIYENWNKKIHEADYLISNSYFVPAGVIDTNRSYNYYITAYNDIQGQDVDNVSTSPIFPGERPHFSINPSAPDTDGDGVLDGEDNCPDTVNSNQIDTDCDCDVDGIEIANFALEMGSNYTTDDLEIFTKEFGRAACQ